MGRDPEDQDRGATGRGKLSAFVVADSHESRDGLPSDVASAQARATRAILDEAYARARELLLGRMELLSAVAGYLYEHERMTGDDLEAVYSGSLGPADPYGWRHVSAKPRAWEEIGPLFMAEPALVLVGPSGPSAPARDRRRGGWNKVRRAIPRPVHRLLREVVARIEADDEGASTA